MSPVPRALVARAAGSPGCSDAPTLPRRWSHALPVVVLALGVACSAPAPPADEPAQATAALATNDQLILASARIAMPPEAFRPEDLPDPNSPGAALVIKYCAQCHAIPSPTMHSPVDWPGVVRRMWLRMDYLPADLTVASPPLSERVAIVEYLTRNGLQVSGATLPEAPGREAFATICSRCHSLPSPSVHSPAEWPAVFMRMEQNMDRMRVVRPTQDQTAQILSYLQEVGGQR